MPATHTPSSRNVPSERCRPKGIPCEFICVDHRPFRRGYRFSNKYGMQFHLSLAVNAAHPSKRVESHCGQDNNQTHPLGAFCACDDWLWVPVRSSTHTLLVQFKARFKPDRFHFPIPLQVNPCLIHVTYSLYVSCRGMRHHPQWDVTTCVSL